MSIKIFLTIAASFLILFLQTSQAQLKPTFLEGHDPKPQDTNWQPVAYLSDEFNEQNIDLEKWQIEPVENGWNWIGRAPGLFEAKNVSVRDGKLAVEVGTMEPQLINGKTFKYYGGIVRALEPGGPGMYYECKMKANATEMSSTFWLMSRYDCEKKQELDIQECVGVTSELTHDWAKNWDQIYHSNTIHRPTKCVERTQIQKSLKPETKNHERFYVYGCWWKSETEIQFFLDGKYVYSLTPNIDWDQPAWLHMAIETYDWNPVPEDGGMVKRGSLEERLTQYDWVRVWELKE
ncbi:MAG: glycosyl hydrolase [Bacteroidota bacterium]